MACDGLTGRGLAEMAIALRTPDYGELLQRGLEKLDEENGANPHDLGWARHSYNDVLEKHQVVHGASSAARYNALRLLRAPRQ
jgi:hypothetical protein